MKLKRALALGSVGILACAPDGRAWLPRPDDPRVTLVGCTEPQEAVLALANAAGSDATEAEAFRACVRLRVGRDYLACRDGPGDPSAAAARAGQLDVALAAVAASARSSLYVRCDDLPKTALARAVVEPADDEDSLRVARSFLDDVARYNRWSAVRDPARVAWLAAALWHERMHQRGYRHTDDAAEEGGGARCGHPADAYERDRNSMPYIIGDCVYAAAMEGSAVLRDATAGPVAFGLGRTTLAAPLPARTLEDIVQPARSLLRICGLTTEAVRRCQAIDNPSHEVAESRAFWVRDVVDRVTDVELTTLAQ